MIVSKLIKSNNLKEMQKKGCTLLVIKRISIDDFAIKCKL